MKLEIKLLNRVVIKRILMVFMAVLLLFAGIFSGLTIWAIRSPLPKTKGKIEVTGLKKNVDIYRDSYGIPHIYADNRADMLFAQGYVHSQDRFWQMECARRLADGRLAEVLGVAVLESDKYMRKVGFGKRAKSLLQYYEKNEPQIMEDLSAYTAGINAYVKENKNSLSLSQHVFNLIGSWEADKWSPYDTVLYSLYMSWSFGASWDSEKNNSILQNKIDPKILKILFPPYPTNRPYICDTSGSSPKEPEEKMLQSFSADRFNKPVTNAVTPVSYMQSGITTPLNPNGSNGWVVSGKYTDTGKPLLANDAHLWISMPSYWYLMSLHAPGFDVTGFSFPGGPGIIVGRNKTISWGITNSVVDVQDLFRLRVNPKNESEYEYNGKWLKFSIHKEVIKVAGQADYILETRQSHYGPVISDDSGYAGEVLALRWEGFEKNTRMFKAIMNMDKASNYTEFKQALSEWDSPSICFLYADVDNNIAMQLVGNVPKRNYKSTRTPLPGWNNEYDWTGWYQYSELPSELNPEKGYIVATNNSFNKEENPPLYITVPGNRAQRATDLLEKKIKAGDKITSTYCSDMQMDCYSLFAHDYSLLFKNIVTENKQLKDVMEKLSKWDCQMKTDSQEAAIFSIFTYMLVNNVYKNKLSEDIFELYKNNYNLAIYLSLQTLAKEKNHPLWDDKNTPAKETRDDIISKSLADALDWLEKKLGEDKSKWKWGTLHTVNFRSAPLGMSGIKPLEWLVNRGPYPVAGDAATLNNHDWYFSNIGNVGMHPSMRFIVDISKLNGNQGILAIGQSGHPTHKNYDDMIPLWLRGEELQMPLSENIIKGYKNHLSLQVKD
ncbi:MAG: penicillin acylase family protein [Clostridia bacterium]|nr:penicillin acylase family protein [Clostridia bacterium]